MKRKLLLILLGFYATYSLNAQDFIITKKTDRIEAKIVSVTDSIVEFTSASNPEGPVYKLRTDKISSILYANGDAQSFEQITDSSVAEPQKHTRRNLFSYGENDIRPSFKNHYEMFYGFGTTNSTHHLGFSYTHVPQRLGVTITLEKSLVSDGFSLMAGPSYTFKVNRNMSSWQAFIGGGISIYDSVSPAIQGGIRYSLDKGLLRSTESLSFTGGIQYLNRELVPFVGMSIVPATTKMRDWWDEKMFHVPHHFSEGIIGYGGNEWYIGANYSYMPSKIGMYGSFMYGFEGDYCANIGPSLRLTNSDETWVDVHLFQGIGVFSNRIGGETGFRFGFGKNRKFSLWSLSTSMCYSKDHYAVTAGLSWPIVGITAAAAAVVIYTIGVVYTGGEFPDLSDTFDGSPSTSPYSPSGNGSRKLSCEEYQLHYEKLEQTARSIYESMTRNGYRTKDSKNRDAGGRNNMDMSVNTFTANQSNLKKAQRNMRDWRKNALKNGCRITPSNYESITVSY